METNTQENKKKLEELEEAAKPLIKYLCENYHPHVTAIVTPTSVGYSSRSQYNRICC